MRGGGSVRAQTEVQWLGLETLNWGAGTGSGTGGSVVLGTTPAVAVTAAVEAESSGNGGRDAGRRRASLGGGEYEVAIWTNHPPPPPGLYRTNLGSRRVSLPNFRYF